MQSSEFDVSYADYEQGLPDLKALLNDQGFLSQISRSQRVTLANLNADLRETLLGQ